MTSTVERRLNELNNEKAVLLTKLQEERANKRFLCVCGKTHRIKDCDAKQDHWYEGPHGCMGGDFWHTGTFYVVCPTMGAWNKLWFDSKYSVDPREREKFDYNAQSQFTSLYSHLFRNVENVYLERQKTKFEWANNDYFDKNRNRFGIYVKGLDDKKVKT